MNLKVWDSLKITPLNTSVVYSLKNKSFLFRKAGGFALKYIIKNTYSKLTVNPRYYENAFAIDNLIALIKKSSPILDIGSAESEFPLYVFALGYDITAFDQREYPFVKSVKGDALELSSLFDPGSFDAITVISTIEHIGIGAYGDTKKQITYNILLNNWKKVLKPGGLILLTLPVTSDTKRIEPGQLVENIDSVKKLIHESDGNIIREKLIIENSALANGWEEISINSSLSYSTGVYMSVIQYNS
jgi:SAM-dependent methyltransferase